MNTDKKNEEKKDKKEKEEKKTDDKATSKTVDDADVDLLKRYGRGPYSEKIKDIDDELKNLTKEVNKLCGIKESDTGLSLPTNWILDVRFDQ